MSRFIPGRVLRALPIAGLLVCGCALLASCGGGEETAPSGRGGRPGGGGRPSFGGGGSPQRAAVPVEVASVRQRAISSYIESNGALEAETEVDVVARIGGPVTQLSAEEGQRVTKGQLLAKLDQADLSAQLEVSRVALEESRLAWERAQKLHSGSLISREEFDRARAAFESARAQFEGNELQMSYTTIRAPFSGWIIERYVDFAQQVTANTPLFRLSDFDPLLCRIQVPERDLPMLRMGQRSYLTVEAYGDQRYDASVLRISPVVDATSGTVRVTLAVQGKGQLRPGMFANVFVETETRDNTLVIPKSALALDSVGDAVYVAAEQAAARREVSLGFEEGDFVEILSGLEAGEQVVVVGQDGLSDGTPLQVLVADGKSALPPASTGAGRPGSGAMPAGAGRPGGGGGAPDIEQIKARMKERGMTDEQIETRLKEMRKRFGGGDASAAPDAAAKAPTDDSRANGAAPRGKAPGDRGGRPRIDWANATPEQIEQIKQRMKDRGLSETQIEERIKQMKARAQNGEASAQ